MSDYRQAWEREQVLRREEFADRASTVLRDLADRYLMALNEVAVVGVPREGGSTTRRRGPTVPVRFDVLDETAIVEGLVARYASMVRGSLKMGFFRPGADRVTTTASELGRWADNIGALADEDPGLAGAVTSKAWRAAYRLGVTLGVQSRAFPIADACGACGLSALWVDPGRALIRCGACGADRAVDVDLVVHSTVSAGVDSDRGLTSTADRHPRSERSETT